MIHSHEVGTVTFAAIRGYDVSSRKAGGDARGHPTESMAVRFVRDTRVCKSKQLWVILDVTDLP